MADKITEWAKELQSLAQAGLFYGRDAYDRERYQRVREIAAEMMSERTGLPLDRVTDLFCADSGYQTPKVDTRAAIFNKEGKLLLVKEAGGLWALPGGWCEFNLSPAENTVKEAREEAGLDVRALRLIAVQDREKHNKPPFPYVVVKIIFLCEALGGRFTPNLETVESGYFGENELPPLHESKTTLDQAALCFRAYRDENWQPLFD